MSRKKNMKRAFSGPTLKKTVDLRETVTDWYLLLMLLVYCLWLPETLSEVAESKFLFFAATTLLWFILLVIFSFVEGPPGGFFTPARVAAVVFAAVCVLSALFSPFDFSDIIIGHRHSGLLTQLLLAMILIGVSRFGHCKERHFIAFGISITIVCVICVVQLMGYNIFGIYPGDKTYYSWSAYLGTIGNVDIFSALIGLAVPLFLGLSVKREAPYDKLYLIPLFLSAFMLTAGRADAGRLGVAAAAVAAPAVLVRSMKDLRRTLAGAAVALVGIALGSALHGGMSNGELTMSFVLETMAVVCLILAAVFVLAAGLLRYVRREPSGRAFRNAFIAFAVAAVLGTLTVVWFWPGEKGTIYQASQILHGNIKDGYGSGRIGIWRVTLTNVPERPLLGGGPGTLRLRTVHVSSRGLVSGLAHNVYLQYLVDTGVLGLLSYLAVVVTSVFVRRRGQWDPARAGLVLAALSYAVQDFFNLGVPVVSPFFWIVLGLLQTETHEKPRPPEARTR